MKNFLFLSLLICSSCTHIEEVCEYHEISYYSEVKPIIETRCASSSGCHGYGSYYGNLNDYKVLDSLCKIGKFNKRVLVKKDMPPGGIQGCEFLTLKRWFEQGHKQK